MRILLAVTILAALGWSGYWLVGARMAENGAERWFAERADEGWVVDHGEITVRGFPNRFDLTIRDVDLADPETGVAWRAPFFQVFALSYRPGHVIAVWPETQTIATPNQKITVTSGDMRASAVVTGRARVLDRATLTFDAVGLSSTADWQGSMARGQLAIRRTPAAEASYDIALSAQDVTVPSRVAALLGERGLVSEVAEGAEIEATIAFDRVWDRRAIEERRPQPRRIDIDLARAQWGELDLRLAGEIDVSATGTADGEVTVKATNWREIVTLAEAAGAWPESATPMIERGLETLAGLSGNPRTIDVPLSIDQGRVSLGGIVPLGRAPLFRLR